MLDASHALCNQLPASWKCVEFIAQKIGKADGTFFLKSHLNRLHPQNTAGLPICFNLAFYIKLPSSYTVNNSMVTHHSQATRFISGTAASGILPTKPETARTLLIIDDEQDMCLLLRRALRSRFEHIEFAHSLTEGVVASLKNKPSVILLDNNLPDGFGIHHIQLFRTGADAVQIVMVSAMDIHYEALEAGADEFIGKPVDMVALHTILDKGYEKGN